MSTSTDVLVLDAVSKALAAQPGKPLAIGIDASASTPAQDTATYQRIITAIMSRKPGTVHLFFFGMKVRHAVVQTPQEAIGAMSSLHDMGGGTDFNTVLRSAQHQDPALILMLSDMCGHVTITPKVPVVWVVADGEHGLDKPPFGTVIRL